MQFNSSATHSAIQASLVLAATGWAMSPREGGQTTSRRGRRWAGHGIRGAGPRPVGGFRPPPDYRSGMGLLFRPRSVESAPHGWR